MAALAVVAYSSGIRSDEGYNLRREFFSKARTDRGRDYISCSPFKTKGNPAGRGFHITDPLFIKIFETYKQTFEDSSEGWFYRCWNQKYKKWNVTRKGLKFFQLVPRQIAMFLTKPNFLKYSHHSFRRTMATSMYERGATRQQIKIAGGWKSDKVVEHYIQNSSAQLTKTADILARPGAIETCTDLVPILPASKPIETQKSKKSPQNALNKPKVNESPKIKQKENEPELELELSAAKDCSASTIVGTEQVQPTDIQSILKSKGVVFANCSNITLNFN